MKIVILVLSTFLLTGCFTVLKQFTNSGSPASNQGQRVLSARTSDRFTIPSSYNTAYSYRTDSPDPSMNNILRTIENLRTRNPDEYIAQAARLINANSRNDFDKFKKAHDLVTITVRYDAASFFANRIPDQSYQNVLRTSLAVCEGYANLIKRLSDELNIPCIVVHGYARGVGSSAAIADTPNVPNHAWNIVTINGASYHVDSTWNAGFLDGRAFRQRYTTDYLFLKPEHIIYSHFPSNQSHQLLLYPLTAAQFSSLPMLKPKFFDAADNLSVNLEKVMRVTSRFSFEYTVKDGYYLTFRINDARRGREVQDRTFVQRNGSRHTVHFSLPSSGKYIVNIFYWEEGKDQGSGCGEFVIEATRSSKVEFPTIFSSSARNPEIISPIYMPLERGKTYTFQIRVTNKNNAAIIHGSNFVQMTRGRDGLFSADFRIPNNISELSIGVADTERGRYEFIAKYKVE